VLRERDTRTKIEKQLKRYIFYKFNYKMYSGDKFIVVVEMPHPPLVRVGGLAIEALQM
jgi:hypothetical protein